MLISNSESRIQFALPDGRKDRFFCLRLVQLPCINSADLEWKANHVRNSAARDDLKNMEMADQVTLRRIDTDHD